MTRCEKFKTGKMVMKREVGKDMEAASLGLAENTTLEIIPKWGNSPMSWQDSRQHEWRATMRTVPA